MGDWSLSQCAAPHCNHEWHKMGEGKLFLFPLRSLTASGENRRKVWLCEECFENWEVTIRGEGEVLLYPLAQLAS
jgi:hypothetical protein